MQMQHWILMLLCKLDFSVFVKRQLWQWFGWRDFDHLRWCHDEEKKGVTKNNEELDFKVSDFDNKVVHECHRERLQEIQNLRGQLGPFSRSDLQVTSWKTKLSYKQKQNKNGFLLHIYHVIFDIDYINWISNMSWRM